MRYVALCVAVVLSVQIVRAQSSPVWVASPWKHVLKSTKPSDGETVSLQCAANEYEIFRSHTGKVQACNGKMPRTGDLASLQEGDHPDLGEAYY